MLGVHVDLQPVLVKEYSDEFELIVVEVITGNTKIRIMTGYGPQESWEEEKQIVFLRPSKLKLPALSWMVDQ